MISNSYSCEYLIIGSGAGGSSAAMELCNAGKDVIMLEEGGTYSDYQFDSPAERIFELYRNSGVTPIRGRPDIAFAEGCLWGGTTEINGGVFWRTPNPVLKHWKKNLKNTLYEEDLIPHFLKHEKLLNVTSNHRVNANENNSSKKLIDSSLRLGWNIVSAPRVVIDCKNSNQCGAGCPTGAKQSMSVSYLPMAISKGLIALTSCKASSVKRNNTGAFTVSAIDKSSNNVIEINCKKIILSCGALQTPNFIYKNKLLPQSHFNLAFHINLKVAALFPESINSNNETIFTHQIQEFEETGIYIASSNTSPSFLATTLSSYSSSTINFVTKNSSRMSLYVAQIKSNSIAKLKPSKYFSNPSLSCVLSNNDQKLIKKSILLMSQVLFEAGAQNLYYPVKNGELKSMHDAQKLVDTIDLKSLELISVHAMSSCPMYEFKDGGLVDAYGRLKGYKDIFICDASVLPSNIGESPQETIMSFASEIMTRNLND
jgi:choline dehydrogenase-like flavoprotein